MAGILERMLLEMDKKTSPERRADFEAIRHWVHTQPAEVVESQIRLMEDPRALQLLLGIGLTRRYLEVWQERVEELRRRRS